MVEWKLVRLSELGEIVGGATPSTSREEYYQGDIPWLTPKDLAGYSGRYIGRGARSITKAGLESCSVRMLPPNTVLFSSRAPIGYVAIAQNELCTNQGFKNVVPNGNVDPLFLYYLLKYNKNKIEALGSGTIFKEVSGATMKNVEVVVPTDVNVQKRIAAILSALDDKIELNNKINANLEQQAQALFNEICKNGDSFSLADILEVCYGKDHKRLRDGGVPCYGTGGVMRYVERALYEGESVLIPRKGSLNNVMYVNEAFWTVDTLFYTRMKRPNIAKLVYFFLCNLNLAKMNVGSAVPSMTTAILNAIEITLPDEETCSRFERIVSPMFLQIQSNKIENCRLAKIRDVLLQALIGSQTVKVLDL